ncbi:MAG: superoxide dismutase [Phycisphaerae bacterium]|jgi:Fe-Mn family superoxide dismutase
MSVLSRREILGSAALLGGWYALGSASAQAAPAADDQPASEVQGPYRLPPLPYDYADLEPHLDAQTMKLHHDVHHAGYVRGANAAVAELEEIRRVGGNEIHRVRTVTESLAFNASGHLLHTLFFESMKRGGGGDPAAGSEIAQAITRDFGTIDAFRAQLAAAAQQVQGSGWSVLALEPVSQRLLVLQAEKHQNLGVWGCVPLLAIDVWEHAYYLKFQNRRSDFIKAFLNVVNWDSAQARLQQALKLV